LIVGPDDYTDRFTYWIARVADGGEVLAPGRPDRHVQFIDVRDLAEWIVLMVEARSTGVYNANGRPNDLMMENVLNEARIASGSNASFTWLDEAFLLQEGVAAWSELPLWLPEEAAPHLKGLMFINSNKAVDAKLRYRSLTDTVNDTLSWYQTERIPAALVAGLDRDREWDLLRKWHER
jgi:2'-hydroxyisoflavone reductase